MAKNRTIPFGYMMQCGRITANPKEVLAVVKIFSEYLAGKSLSEIAAEMDVPYSENSKWNKNMVKRIIENEKYLGTPIFPQLISEEFSDLPMKKELKRRLPFVLFPVRLTKSEKLLCVTNAVTEFSEAEVIHDRKNGTAVIPIVHALNIG